MTDLDRRIEGRADAVADWLMERLREREAWLWSELLMAAEQAAIDLEEWVGHPLLDLPYCEESIGREWGTAPMSVVYLKPEDGEVSAPEPADPSGGLRAAVEDLAAKIDEMRSQAQEQREAIAQLGSRLAIIETRMGRVDLAHLRF